MIKIPKPINEHILLKRPKTKEKTSGGLFIPEQYQKKEQIGYVIAVGDGAYRKTYGLRKPPAKVGQTVMFHKMAGFDMILDGEEYTLVRDIEILSILT